MATISVQGATRQAPKRAGKVGRILAAHLVADIENLRVTLAEHSRGDLETRLVNEGPVSHVKMLETALDVGDRHQSVFL